MRARVNDILVNYELEGLPGPPVVTLSHSQIEGPRLEVMPGALHLTNVEAAPVLNKALLDFLA